MTEKKFHKAKEEKEVSEELKEVLEEPKETEIAVEKEEYEILKKELEILKRELEAKKTEAADYLDTLQRLKAEFENYKKRILREQTQFLELASQDLIIKLLSVLDNFELAIYAAEETKDYEKMVKGIEMVYGEFRDVLRKEGLKVVEAEGKEFDPEVHEAVMQVHSDKHEDNMIVDVLRSGYTFKGRLVRPAMVKVAKK